MEKDRTNEAKKTIFWALIFVFAIIVVYKIGTYLIDHMSVDNIKRAMHDYGLIGIFFMVLIGNLTLFLPMPIDLAIYVLGSFDFGFGFLSPAIIGIVAGFGAGIGELSGYAAGFLGRRSVRNLAKGEHKRFERVYHEIKKHGLWFIIIASFTPFPFDLVGIAAGIVKYDLKKFLLGAIIGKILRCALIAYAGYFSLSFIAKLFGVGL
ncbi:MAG: VTT domain-containing protein [Candidatus Diapherotrites archaeon]|nr:VTT domain-containing protein [Candidatus Diapherotrites archaeon]